MDKIKKWLCCAYAVLRKGVCNMILAAKASLSGESAKVKKKSPIKFLLHVAGHSTWWEGFCRLLVVAGVWTMAAMMLLVMPVVWLISSSPLASIMLGGLILLLLAFILYFAWGDDMDNYLLGSQGERAVADTLVHFTRTNWCVFHDFRIPGKNWNIDHIVVCPKGVICIETKTMRRYEDETRKLRFDGKRVFWGTDSSWRPLPWDPVEKVERYAEQMKEFLRREGIQLDDDSVTPMIIYPGWEFAEDSVDNDKIIVGSRKKIRSLVSLEKDEGKLSDRDIMEIAKVLKPKSEFALDE